MREYEKNYHGRGLVETKNVVTRTPQLQDPPWTIGLISHAYIAFICTQHISTHMENEHVHAIIDVFTILMIYSTCVTPRTFK